MSVSVHLRLVDQFTRQARTVRDSLQAMARSASDLQRAFSGSSTSGFARMQGQVRGLAGEVRGLVGQFARLGRAISAPAGGSFAQRQISELQQVLTLQRQIIANNGRMMAGPAGPGGLRLPGRQPVPSGGPLAPGVWGRRGFNPNASLADRLQNRVVGFGEQSLIGGALELDRARTQLQMLVTPRRNPNNPEELLPGVITPQVVGQAEAAAVQLSQHFRALNRAHILDTFRELVTQFSDVNDAFTFLPELLRIQEWQVLQGDNIQQAREGMLRLVRAIGLSGRLIGNDGRLQQDEAGAFLDNYLRARMIGGRDVTPDQVFQVMKYLRATGQTMNQDALLMAFIAMPDVRGTTFGHTLNMLRIQLLGRATQAAQQAMAEAGLGTITERTASGPHRFTPVDRVLLEENQFEWFNRHILGPTGYLRRQGVNPLTASQAEIAAALQPIFGQFRYTSASMAQMIVSQQAEWRAQIDNARRANLTDEARVAVAGGSAWYQLVAARSALFDTLSSVTENFKKLLPALESITNQAKKIAAFVDPQVGSPFAGLGLLGAGGLAAFIMMRRVLGGLGPLNRLLIGGGAGFLLGGGITGALTGALLLRSMAGPAAAAAAAVVGTTLGRRILGGLLAVMRGIPGFLLLSGVIAGIEAVATNWESIKPRLLAVWEELQQAAPRWLGGEGRGWSSLATAPALNQTSEELDAWLRSTERSIQDWARTTPLGQWLDAHGLTHRSRIQREALAGSTANPYVEMFGQTPPANTGVTTRAFGKGTVQSTVNVGGVSVTVNVQTNANPQTIGDAAGNAVASEMRRLLGDVPYE